MIQGAKLKYAFKDFHKSMDAEKKRLYKAVQGSLRIVGFKLKKELQNDLRRGKAGGQSLSPLTRIRSRMRRGKSKSPLARLAFGVRYHVASLKNRLHLQVGFIGPTSGTESRALIEEFGYGITEKKLTSKSWIGLAKRHQEGFTTPVTPSLRRYFIRYATESKFGKKPRRGDIKAIEDRRFFFFRKGTTQLQTPGRLIIAPFWREHRKKAERDLPVYFRRKMRGERI